MNPYSEKLSLLRAAMRDNNIDTYIIPSTDPHLGEYITDHWRVIAWLTGFTGSSATVIVTDSFAGLWTDSRYFIQAEDQLAGTGFILMQPMLPDNGDFIAWMADKLKPGNKIAFDQRTLSIVRMRKIEKALEGNNVSFDIDSDIISELWTDRPSIPALAAFDHSVLFCGKERSLKIMEVREQMRRQNLNYHLLTSEDDIIWLLNIRGNDVKYSPLLTCFAIIGEEQILLFTDETKIPLKLASAFDKLGIVMLPYEETAGMLSALPSGSSILITPGTTSVALFNAISRQMKIKEDVSIPARLKAVKNKTEIENIENAMVKDGAALTEFFYWVECNSDSVIMSELSLAEKLNELRSLQKNYLGPSFSPVVAFNKHGALPHYSATPGTDSAIGPSGILLVDSGGQYLDGTTDITRTIAIGRPSANQRKDFTLVLKGMINLALAKFPSGTKGYQLDILARKALWEQGLNYGHGTGHGVGFCLNVHEGPQNISPGGGADAETVLEPGMLTSDEPAIYREGEYGIRTENLILCYEDEETEFGQFLKFETVSLCYIDKSLINISLLDQKEIDWLNSYHAKVYEKLSPFLTGPEIKWLREKTDQI